MEELKTTDMSNAELKLKIHEYENEYEALKNNIAKAIERMDYLDVKYNEIQNELKKRGAL